MDISTLIGFLVGIALIIGSILMGSALGAFINAPGILVVVGGTLAAALISEELRNVLTSFKVALKTFFNKSPRVEDTIKQIAELAVVVRKEGLLALENQELSNRFLAKAVRLAVDGVPAEDVQAALRGELIALKARHKRGQQLFKFMAATAPAMGMIGTLIGLVQMLQSLNDPSSIGPAMAVALLTTFYGAVIAFLFMTPIATKLEHRSREETANMVVIIEGLDSILKGENARLVQEKLEGHLPPDKRSENSDDK